MPTKNTGFPLGPSLGYDSGLSCLFPRLCRNDFRQTKSLDRTRLSSQLTPEDRRPLLLSRHWRTQREREGGSLCRETEEIFFNDVERNVIPNRHLEFDQNRIENRETVL